ncbi:MAG: hypothetical protein HW386_1430 [Gammaproteobacteria bacterium]|nr:hypothetical protein [Gammaproteobacteria bacterium]
MNKSIVLKGIIAGLVLQLLVLAVEYLGAMYPLWTGQEVTLKVIPVDPRSLFRGNYARLNFDISTVPVTDIPTVSELRFNQFIYVRLKPGDDGISVYDGASLARPASGLFIRGRVQGDQNIKYGIEAFFAAKEKALELEEKLRTGGLAKVMIAGNGKAALQDVTPLP